MDERLASDVNGMAVWHLLGVDVRTHEKEGKMTRQEAAKKWEWVVENFNDSAIYLWPDERQKLIESISLLRGPQPDPITGLVPCGCGGRAFVYCPVDMTDVFVIRCEKCRVGITFAMDLPRAKKEWNTAMGWRVEG